MRLFIAINLPAAERRAIGEATALLRDAPARVSWVREDCLHLTMKFLGEQPPEAVGALRGALGGAAARSRTPVLRLGGVCAFPNLRAPRVVWLGVGHDAKLELLHHDVESACAVLGYEIDGRPFRPHITLGRLKSPLPRDGARALAEATRRVAYASTVTAQSVDIMASELSAAGPRYTVLAALPLGSD